MRKNKNSNDMKDKIREILVKYNDNKSANDKAEAELLDLFIVRLSLPTDIQIEETADVAYKHVREYFPINDEYCYTQGYINGMTALRNNIQNNEA